MGKCKIKIPGNPKIQEDKIKQFAIRNSQFAITFCDGDLDPNTKQATHRGWGLKPFNLGSKIARTTEKT
jgi:hypothetical protein